VRDAGGAGLASDTNDPNRHQMGGDGLTLAYTAYNKPHRIERAGVRADFGYDPERRRLVQVLSEADGGPTTTTLYIGRGYERVIRGAELSHRYHVYAEGQLVLVRRVGSDGGEALRYVHRDHLGSTEVLSDEAGAEVERLSFGAFGARRLADWRAPGEPAALGWVKRGYTGHLELEALGLIDMGARIYEPRLGRFLSADTVVPEPGAPQSLNRYSYVNNNPLSLTDPSGHFPVTPGPAPMGLDEGMNRPGYPGGSWV
jgi:RHS repeat-associated protein